MFRRARLSVKPNVRPGVGSRGSTVPNPQRGLETPKPPEPSVASTPKPAESTDVSPVDFGGAEPQEKTPGNSEKKTDGDSDVEETTKSSSAVSQRKKRISSTSNSVKPNVSIPSEPHPLSTVSQEALQSNSIPSKQKQPCSDRYRIYKAQKLREMLKEELRKEKKQWKNKYVINESQRPPDRSKMTMRDFIYYLPDNNPMTSSLEQEKKVEKSLPPVQTREQEGKSTADTEDNEETEEETDDGPLLVPRVKVAEDGSIILDEESLTVEVLRTKGPCVVEENDPIFERGSTTTYSSFRKNYYSKPWSNKETDMFFLAISMVGTDFSMIGQLFPHRARIEIKNKFKREEKTNGWRIDKAFQEKRPFDFDFFAHLLQKVLAEEEKRKQKSVKNQNVLKKSSKPRKNVKVKKIASEEVNDDPDESMSTKISDTEGSPEDVQAVNHSIVEEEEQTLTLSGQNLEQVVLEPDPNQKKKRKKNQDEAGKQEVKDISGNATVQSGPSKGEKQKNKSHSLRPEIDEGEGNKEQTLSCIQNIDDIVGFPSDEKVEERIDPILSSSNQQDAMSVGSETLESSILDLPSSEVGIHALCLENNAEINSTEERNVDLSKKLETDQAENVKPMVRGRFQRPKPNLSRAVGKKSVLSQGKTDAESKSLHPETSIEKDNMEIDKMNTFDISGMENTEKENPETEAVSNLSDKTGLQADEQPKTLRPAQLMRGRLQRPKPNVSKAAERKETLTSQEKTGDNVQKIENETCIDEDISEQIEDQPCKNVDCEEVTSQSEKIQPDEPKVLNECLSIQEDNNANKLKHVPILKSRFQKPKPNIGKGIGRKDILCRGEVPEETLASQEVTISLIETEKLETSTREKVPVETDTVTEMESNLKETERSDTSPRKKIPEMIEVAVEMETDFKETGRDISLGKEIPEVNDASEGKKTDLEETGKGALSLQENAPEEVSTLGDIETGLKEIGKENSPKEKALVGISTLGEKEIHLAETAKTGISLMEKVPGEVIITEATEAYLKETEGEIPLRQRRSEEISTTEEMVADWEKTGNIDISLRKNEPEQTETSRQTETDLIQTSSGDCSTVPSQNIKDTSSEILPVVHTAVEEKVNVEKEISSPSHHSFQTSEPDKVEEQGMLLLDIPQQCPDTNLSKPLPQEQKPFEVKTVPFVRSRFKKPKPNLARAALKRETMEAEKCIPGKKLETDKMEAVSQQNSENTNSLPSQQGVNSLITSTEKDKSDPLQEEAVISPSVQTQKDLSSSFELKEESQSTESQEKELVASVGTENINTLQQEEKGNVTQTAPPIRGRLQRPRPNIRRAGQKQIEKAEAKVIIRDEKIILQKEETEKKLLTVANSPIGTEIEVVSSKVSECSMNDILDEKTRHEHRTHAPSPTHLIRRQSQKAKPNLGKAHGKKEGPCLEKDRANQSEAKKPEDNSLKHRDCGIQLLQKEKATLLTSLEVSPRRDCVDSTEAGLAKRGAQTDIGPSGSAGEKTVGNNTVSSVVEEQFLNKLTSSSQLLKESNYPKITLERRSGVTTASESELDRGEKRIHRKIKPSVTKGRGSKRIRSKTFKKEPRTSKAMLVTLRASQEEEEDDAEDFEVDYEEESYHLAPEELNKAPVFVPVGLRSPEPVPSQIEETMEELEITVNVPDTECIAVVEHQLSNTEVTTEVMKQEENLNALSVEVSRVEHTQDEAGMNDGSTEAAIALLTMGDLVLQSEINTEQSDGNVNYKIVHECQLSSTINSISLASLDEDKIILEEQSTKEKIGLMEKVQENTLPTRDAAFEVTNNLLNLETILGTSRLGVHQEVPNLFITEEVTQRETEENASKATELEDTNLGSVITLESKEQRELICVHGVEETNISQGVSLTERHEDQEEGSQVHILSVAPVVSSDPIRSHTLDVGNGLANSTIEEQLRRDSNGDSVLTLHVPECTPTSIPEVQQENIVSSQDLTVNLVSNVHEDGEDDHTFILTLVEIPANAVEEFTDTTTELMPNSLLPAPILVKSANTEERENMSMSFPMTTAGQDALCSSNCRRDDSEKPPADLDLLSRKRFRCRLNESDHVPPAKKSSLTSRDSCQKYTSEMCSKELINIFEKTGESYKGQDAFPASGSIHITPEPQKEQLEPSTFQSIGSTAIDKIIDTHIVNNTPQLPQDEMIVSDKNERTCSAVEQMDKQSSSSKTPLSRPGRRPLGFLSLICSKNTLESNEPTQVHSKKRLKPLIPVSRQNLKRSNPLNESQKKAQDSSDLLPSPSSVINTQTEDISSSATQVSCDHPLLNEERKSDQNRPSGEEPATISEYFFSDIFIEVDETE
ncbi:PREDICTED: transcription factor TFIIIB component B'' homolog [Condylura cristata]|uniref:transcription factor TFIIIB component B'' homolog n=1 Tax=Condylura cristata TaxID=143302 RepID=UPI00064362FE|nr:PREDICTED: transcription factor TFIIIB component B'' homolog [Condylura cristata]